MADRTYAVVKRDSYKNKFITKEKPPYLKDGFFGILWNSLEFFGIYFSFLSNSSKSFDIGIRQLVFNKKN